MPTAENPSTEVRRALTSEQLQDIMRLIKGSDDVELKLTIGEGHRHATLRALGIDPLDARLRQVFFFDTPDLRLDAAGVVVRARRIQAGTGDTVVKIRPVDPSAIPKSLRSEPTFKLEVDAMPGGYVCSASFRGVAANDVILETAHGGHPIRKLFSKAQRAFYAEHAPEGLALDDLSVLGPVNLFKLKYPATELGRPVVAELWFYPDGSRILELSTKSLPNAAFQAAVEMRAYLESKGIDLSGRQQTKTKAALSFFSKDLSATNGPAAAS